MLSADIPNIESIIAMYCDAEPKLIFVSDVTPLLDCSYYSVVHRQHNLCYIRNYFSYELGLTRHCQMHDFCHIIENDIKMTDNRI